MAKSAEVAVKGNTAVALAMNFEGDAQSGFEQMDQDDFALPFLRILTNMSPEIGEVDGASPGMIYNSVTGELFDGKAYRLSPARTFASISNGHHVDQAAVDR